MPRLSACALSRRSSVQVLILHGIAFVIGHKIGEVVGDGSPALAHTLSLQTGMQVSLHILYLPVPSSLPAYSVPSPLQSSLLALLLASNFFSDPLTCLPCGLSVIVMTLVSWVHAGALFHVLPVLKGSDQLAGWLCSCGPLERQAKQLADELERKRE